MTALLHLEESLDDDLAPGTVLVPSEHEILHFLSFVVHGDFSVVFGTQVLLFSQFREELPFFLVMFSIERQHVLIFADEVIIEDDRVQPLRYLWLFIMGRHCKRYHGQHIVVVVELALAAVIDDHSFVRCCTQVHIVSYAPVAFSFDVVAILIETFFHFFVIAVHQF